MAHSSHVDEGVPHVARVAEVNREVQKIVRTLRQLLVQCFLQQNLCVLIWYVPDHERSASVTEDSGRDHLKLLNLLCCVIATLNTTEHRFGFLFLMLCFL